MTEVLSCVGPVLAVGTLGTRLLNAAGAAAAAGLAGALIGWDFSDEDAEFYESEVRAGKFLVTVDRVPRSKDATAVFAHHGGSDLATGPIHEPEDREDNTSAGSGHGGTRHHTLVASRRFHRSAGGAFGVPTSRRLTDGVKYLP